VTGPIPPYFRGCYRLSLNRMINIGHFLKSRRFSVRCAVLPGVVPWEGEANHFQKLREGVTNELGFSERVNKAHPNLPVFQFKRREDALVPVAFKGIQPGPVRHELLRKQDHYLNVGLLG
jgi:hypothetical protein